jgi:type IV pilus assembly protein PilC
MADFRCRVATPTGEILVRDYQAEDVEILRRDLERQDLLVLAIQRRSSLLTAATSLTKRRKRVSADEFLFFNQEFAALIRAGLPILEALGLLTERRKNPVFKAALVDVRERVRTGQALSEAFAAQGLFPPLYSSSLSSGERSGEIASVILRYVAYTRTILGVRRKVVAALVYPVILMILAAAVLVILMTYVVPNFQGFLEGFGGELPWITRTLMSISAFLRAQWWFMLLGVVGLAVAFVVWKRTPLGQRGWERVTYRIPLAGPLIRRFIVTRYARTLSTLVSGGIPLVTCLEVVGRAIGTPLYTDGTRELTAKVREGASLWGSMEESKLFPEMMIEMVKVGESSGTVAEMLEHVADFTDQEIEHDLQTLTSLIEPLLLVAMAVMVGTILFAIYYPLLQVYSQANPG